MKILALEFSSPQRSVAVLSPGNLTASEVVESARGNTMNPLSMIEAALRLAGVEREQIECLAIGLGPGSYTGIRVAIALAQGWQLAREIKLLGISSVEAVAAEALDHGMTGRMNVLVDAQRNEFYLATYGIGSTGLHEVEPLRLAGFAEVQRLELAGETVIGPEVDRWFPNGRLLFPRATVLCRLAMSRTTFVPGEKLEPIYLRETTFVKAPPSRAIPPDLR